ncbi:MAG: bifunctional rhamnulose-1-phosphate aldolase/short-chain dehydrogenase, partial [Thermoleophilia bacterium]
MVSRAAEALARAGKRRPLLGGQKVRATDEEEARSLLRAALPHLRGALLADSPSGLVLEVDRSPESLAFVSSVAGPQVSQEGAPCPDHLITTKHRPLAVDFDPDRDSPGDLAERLRRGVEEYAAWYRDYCRRNLTEESRAYPIDPAGPRVVLVPGVGIVTSGVDARRARLARDLYRRAVAVESAAHAAGGFRSLSEAEAFAI